MALKIPKRKIGGWARDIVTSCESSRQSRIAEYSTWRNYYYSGDQDGNPASYNKVYKSIERKAANLFSPVDARLSIEYERQKPEIARKQGDVSASFLSREFDRCNVDTAFAQGVKWGLIKGATIFKNNVRIRREQGESEGEGLDVYDGFSPYVIQPESFGVLEEYKTSLDHQEAFFHSTYLTYGEFASLVSGHPEEEELLRKIKSMGNKSRDGADQMSDYFRQVVIGINNPVAQQGQAASPNAGMVNWVGQPGAQLSPQIAADLIRFDELWVQDIERGDWTTIQLAGDDLVVEGKLQRRNLSGIEGHHPFDLICPNPIADYFWGRSEVANVAMIQDVINRRMDGIEAILRLQEKSPKAFIGAGGLTEQKYRAAMAQGGFIAESSPTLKIEDLTPKMPETAFTDLNNYIQFFDDSAGDQSVLQGQGEPGVRAQQHAETLVRMASPALREQALIVERIYESVGDFAFRVLQHKCPDQFFLNPDDEKTGFLLDQIPDDFRVTVDSHSSSPIFSNEFAQMAFNLKKVGAISDIDLLRMLHPPMEDTLVANAEARAEAQAKFIQEHPEEATKHHKK